MEDAISNKLDLKEFPATRYVVFCWGKNLLLFHANVPMLQTCLILFFGIVLAETLLLAAAMMTTMERWLLLASMFLHSHTHTHTHAHMHTHTHTHTVVLS